MRILLLLSVVGLLAGCAVPTAEYIEVQPENRAKILEEFGFAEEGIDPGPYTVLIIAADNEEPHTINPAASTRVTGREGTPSERLSSAERATVNHCLRYKEADETCYVVYKGGWIEN